MIIIVNIYMPYTRRGESCYNRRRCNGSFLVKGVIMKKNSGQFGKGNESRKDTRFKPGHHLSCKYKEEYSQALIDYFRNPEIIFPTVEGFAEANDLAIRTVHDWHEDSEKYPQFATAYAQAMAIQKDRLLVGGLTRKFDASIVRFLAMNNHGMREKVEQDVKADAAFTVNINVED